MTFENCFSKYFSDTIDENTQQLLLKKAQATAYLEMLGNEIIDLTHEDPEFVKSPVKFVKKENEDDTTDQSSSYNLGEIPPETPGKPDRFTASKDVGADDDGADDDGADDDLPNFDQSSYLPHGVPLKFKPIYEKKVQHHFHTLITAHLSAQGNDLSFLRSLLSKHLSFKDSQTGEAESAEKASFRQLVWTSLIKTLANIDHATICAGIPNGGGFQACLAHKICAVR